MTDDDIQALLREMRDEAVPADSLVRVRMRVAEKTAARQGSWWPLVAGFAALVAIVAFLLFVRPAITLPVIAPPAPVMAKMDPAPLVQSPPIRPVRRQGLAPRTAKPAGDVGDVVVRIETADPEVVILLLGD